MKGFLKAYKSECRRILHAQHGDLDFSKLEKIIPNDLPKLATKEYSINKSTSKWQKDSMVNGKKVVVVEKSISEQPIDPKVTGENHLLKSILLLLRLRSFLKANHLRI